MLINMIKLVVWNAFRNKFVRVTLVFYPNYCRFCATIGSGEICTALPLSTYVYLVLSLTLPLSFRIQLQVTQLERHLLPAVACQTRARVVVNSLCDCEFFSLRLTDVEHNIYVNICVVKQLFGKRLVIFRNTDYKYFRIKWLSMIISMTSLWK